MMQPEHPPRRPQSDLDLHTDEALLNPYPLYRQLRDLGPAVWLTKYDMYGITRYKDVRESLRDWQIFSSAHGVALLEPVNQSARGTTLASDPPLHDKLRAVVGKPLGQGAVRQLSDQIAAEAESLVESLVARGSFDVVADLAWHLPLTIVSRLVGVPEEGRQKMPAWGAAGFDGGGPANQRALNGFQLIQEFVSYITDPALPSKLVPGSWGAQIFEAAARGDIAPEQGPMMLADYLLPSLDTTVSATGSAIWLLAQHPAQWEAIRADVALIPNAIQEAVRMESPIPYFTRYVAQDHEIEGVKLPKASRALLLYASANRDERKWQEPERFDIRRKVADHLGFGYGVHSCAGMHLARLEIQSLLNALAKRVKRFEIISCERKIVNGLRSLKSLHVSVH